ncbi:hypothetical protein ACIF9R_36455 [Streptomyces sp. NPDC086080]|uniref:hypothetical protein n=1 Tax=Streptomyces sp. NPDC086080 TaxID=3365748 RepID=UPI0037D1059C
MNEPTATLAPPVDEPLFGQAAAAMRDRLQGPPLDEPLTGRDALDMRDRVHLLRFARLAHRSRTLVRLDRTLPAHCPARVTRHGTRRMLLIAPGLTPAERVAFLDAALKAGQ